MSLRSRLWDGLNSSILVIPDSTGLQEDLRRFRLAQIEHCANHDSRDIGTAEPVLGPKDKLSTPLQLPW